jgi:colanic acid biosynthesis glycosyl transferase WcaI
MLPRVSLHAHRDGGSARNGLPMKILIHGLNFAPELIGVGKYTGEMVQWLVRRGHEVRVVAAPPYYPRWEIDPGYANAWSREDAADGSRIYRCPVWLPKKPRGPARIAHLMSFGASSAPVAVWQAITWRPDVVIGVEPTLFAAVGSLVAARLSGARCWLHVQDFEIDAAFGVDLLRNNFLRHVAIAVEGIVLRRFDRVSSISAAMCDRLCAKGVREDRTKLVPNWVDIGSIYPLASPSPLRDELGIPTASIVALYAGSMNGKQGVEILGDVACRLAARTDIIFLFAGSGPAHSRLAAACNGLRNVRFLPVQPAERLNDLLNLADIHLLPQRRGVADLVLPSKLVGMMASGRPVVAAADHHTQVGKLATRCGIVVIPEDGEAMAHALVTLADDPHARRTLGRAGREIAASAWDRDAVLGRLEAWLLEVPAPKRVGWAAVRSRIRTRFGRHVAPDLATAGAKPGRIEQRHRAGND